MYKYSNSQLVSNRPHVRRLLALTLSPGAPTADVPTARRSASNLSFFLRLRLDRSLGGTALRFRSCNLAQFRRRVMEERFTYHTRRASTRGGREMRHEIGLSELLTAKEPDREKKVNIASRRIVAVKLENVIGKDSC